MRNVILILLMSLSVPAIALDTITYRSSFYHDPNSGYKQALVAAALENTREKYGDYKIEPVHSWSNNSQSFEMLAAGTPLNIHMAPTTIAREQLALPIRIPIRKGLLNYRLLLIKSSHAQLFQTVNKLSDLQQLTIGLVSDWAFTSALQKGQLNIIAAPSYRSLFAMLDNNRFDFTLRGINEVYVELENLTKQKVDAMVVPDLAVYFNTPSYVFVSPKFPRLAERLNNGLNQMINSGEFDKLFTSWHETYINKAKLDTRHIIHIDNHNLPPQTPLNRQELWFHPKQPPTKTKTSIKTSR